MTTLPLPDDRSDGSGGPSPAAEPRLQGKPSQDAEIVARIRLGDTAAFESLFHEHYERLCAFALGYLRSAQEAEDVVQDLFAKLWERRAEWEVRGTIRSYLYSAARNRALSHLRHGRVVTRWEEGTLREIAAKEPAGTGADERVRTSELAQALSRAIERLPPRRRQAYTLRWQHELSLAEIAAVMDVSVKCVELQLASASKTVREALRDFF